MWGARRAGPILAVLVAVLSVPFWGKAFHIDDPFFVAIAENVRRDPWRPFGGAVALDDTDHRIFGRIGVAPNTFETLSHPPLVPYAIAAAARLAGGIGERAAHAAFVVFPALAAWAQYRLARRFTRAPLWAAVVFAACPLAVLAAHGLMTDLPSLALALAAIALFVEGVDEDDARRLCLAGALAGAAVLARYVWLGLLPLLALYALGRPRRARAWIAVVPFALVLAAWLVQNRAVHGAFHLTAGARHYAQYYEGRYLTVDDLARRALADLSALGGTLLPLAGFLAVRDRSRPGLLAACAALAGLAVLAASRALPEVREYGPAETAALALFVGAALVLLARAVAAGTADTDGRWLLAWLAVGLVCTIVLLPFGAARYLLPVLPPLVLLCARRQAESPGAWAAAAGLAALSLALAIADDRYAGAYREAAGRIARPADGPRVWFIGDWGFRYYMERAGHRYLLSTSDAPVAGDLVVRPRIAGLHEMAPGLAARAERIDTIDVPGGWPIRLMSHEAHAGYYSHGWGLLPFAFSRAPLERFDVFRVAAPPS